MPNPRNKPDTEFIRALRDQVPLRGLSGVRILDVNAEPDQPFDVAFEIESGLNRVTALGEIKPTLTPRTLETITPWIGRLRTFQPEVAFVVLSPYLTPSAQNFCIENNIDFMDLAGNVSINVPGRMTLRRLNMKGDQSTRSGTSRRIIGVYSGKSSRVLRVLLQMTGEWSLTRIGEEIERESARSPFSRTRPFEISLGSISKIIATLEEDLLIRRRASRIIVPEPLRLLNRWAEKYKERYRRQLRSSFTCPNPFGDQPGAIARGLDAFPSGGYALTGAVAASIAAPFVDIDLVEVFVADRDRAMVFRDLKSQREYRGKLRFVYPYDFGVFMYARIVDSVPMVSDIQTYLDLYARGGRDYKQAEYLLEKRILPSWRQQ